MKDSDLSSICVKYDNCGLRKQLKQKLGIETTFEFCSRYGVTILHILDRKLRDRVCCYYKKLNEKQK